MQDNYMNFERPETLYSGERVMKRNGKIQDLSYCSGGRKMFLNLGPGGVWKKPGSQWISLDADPRYADVCVDLNHTPSIPFEDDTVDVIYSSHFFEHISIFAIDDLIGDCYRVLKEKGVLRIVIPDVIKSMREFLDSNQEFSLFKRRRQRNPNYTLFECLREDFLSQSLQKEVFGVQALAHQNAFDYETMEKYLKKSGFKNIYLSDLGSSTYAEFMWENEQDGGEWAQADRSLYIEAVK